MARVLVVHPPVSVARDFIDYPYVADLGAVQLAAVLRDAGHEVGLVDAYALPRSSLAWRDDGRAHLGAPVEDVIERARTDRWDVAVVAFTPFHRPPRRDDVLARVLGGLPGPVVLADLYQSGQHYVEANGDAVLASYPEAAAWVKYEGEVTVPLLVNALSRGERVTGAHSGVEAPSLDALPLPAWDLVDLPAYDAFHARVVERLGRGAWAFPIDGRTLPLVTSRGCPFRCAHCSSNPGRAEGAPKTQRRLSLPRLREHMTALARTHGATRLEVLDELLNVNERHFDGFLEAAAELGVSFDVPNGMRADYLEPRHLRAMRGRVATVSVSAESGVQRVVTEAVGKQLDLGAITRAAAAAQAEKVPLLVHFMIGLPGETEEDIGGTLSYAADLFARYGARPAVQFATPLPGTALARAPGARGLPVVDDWGPRFQRDPAPIAGIAREALLGHKARFDAWMGDAEARAAASVPAAERSRASAPRTASIVTNLRCNEACLWCTRRAAEDSRAFVRGEAVRARIDRALAEGSREILLTGGEPSMRVDLAALVRHARSGGAERVVLETNATLIDGLRAAELRAAGLDLARVHVPAVGDACDALTRDPGGFARAMEGVRALASAGVDVEAAVTLVRSAAPHLPSIPAPLRAIAGASLRALVVGFPVEAANPGELLSFEEAAAAVLTLERATRPLELPVRMSTGDLLPPCAFDARSRPRVTRFYAMTAGAPPRDGYSRVDACAACRLRDRCPGVADAYVARFGPPRAHPIDDDRTRRRLAVVSSVDDQIARELASTHIFADEQGRTVTEETIRVLFRCNQSCTFCFVSTHLPAPPPAAVEAAIRAAGARGARIVLSGGEPTLDPKLVDWVRLARSVSRGILVLQTNAVRLDDPALVTSLEDAGLDEAFVSLHGATAAVSDAVTEAPGTFGRTVAGIDRLHASRVRVVLNYVVCEKNRHELVDHVRAVASRWPRATLNISFVGPSTDLVPRDRALVPRYTDALPSIAAAVDEARRLGVPLIGFESMCGLPLCLVPGGVRELALTEIPPGFDQGEFVKTEECSGCSLERRCWGLRRGYAEIHGTAELRAQQG